VKDNNVKAPQRLVKRRRRPFKAKPSSGRPSPLTKGGSMYTTLWQYSVGRAGGPGKGSPFVRRYDPGLKTMPRAKPEGLIIPLFPNGLAPLGSQQLPRLTF